MLRIKHLWVCSFIVPWKVQGGVEGFTNPNRKCKDPVCSIWGIYWHIWKIIFMFSLVYDHMKVHRVALACFYSSLERTNSDSRERLSCYFMFLAAPSGRGDPTCRSFKWPVFWNKTPEERFRWEKPDTLELSPTNKTPTKKPVTQKTTEITFKPQKLCLMVFKWQFFSSIYLVGLKCNCSAVDKFYSYVFSCF